VIQMGLCHPRKKERKKETRADFEIIPTNKISPVRWLMLFFPTCSLLLPWSFVHDLQV